MADDVLSSFWVALGFKVDESSRQASKRSIADYERDVREAERRIEAARLEGAKTAEEVAKLAREINLKEARAALASAQEREKAEKEQARKRQEHAKAFVAGMTKMAAAATAAATAISYAVSHVTASFDNLYFVSQRTGASVQSLNSLGYAFKQVGGTSQQAIGAVEGFQKALRQNEGLKGFVQSLGIDTTKDAADQLLETVAALNKQGYQVGHIQAEMLGISEDDYNLLVRQADAIKQYRDEYNATTRSLGVDSDKAAEASTSFQRTLIRLQATVAALSDKLMTSLAPAFESIVKGLNDWIAANPEKVSRILEDISRGLVYVTTSIGDMLKQFAGDNGEGFMKRWDAFILRAQTFASTVEKIVYGIEKMLRLLHLVDGSGTALSSSDRTVKALNAISGGTAAPDGPGGINTGGAVPKDDRTLREKILPKFLGGKDAPQAGDGSRSWRNSNPGNIKDGPFARAHGATGADDRGFARFPDYAAGRKAQEELLFNDERYKGLSIKEAIAKYAPGSDGNDPAGYAAEVAKAAGVNVDTRLSDLTADQRGRFLDAQQAKEGWIAGRPTPRIGDSVNAGIRGSANHMHGQYGAPGENLTTIKINSGRSVTVHKEAAESFRGFLNELEAGGYDINNVAGYNNRLIRGGSKLSQHAYGNAIDINPSKNPMTTGPLVTDLPSNVGDMAAKYGLTWGGDWKNRKDAMHFEWAGVKPVPASEKAKAPVRAEMPAPSARPAPRMDPGGFDMSKIDVGGAMKPVAPMGAGNVSHSSSNDNSRSVVQHITNNTQFHGVENPREAGRLMEKSFDNIHGLAIRNAQSAVA